MVQWFSPNPQQSRAPSMFNPGLQNPAIPPSMPNYNAQIAEAMRAQQELSDLQGGTGYGASIEKCQCGAAWNDWARLRGAWGEYF